MFARQKAAETEKRQRKAAVHAKAAFKATRKDRGKVIMITGSGARDAQKRGKRGLLVYVTKKGKKILVKHQGAEPYKTRKLTSLKPPIGGYKGKAVKKFELDRRVMVSEHRAQIRAKGEVKTGGAYDFTDKASDKIAKSLQKLFNKGPQSHRQYFIEGLALIKAKDGKMRTIPFGLPIDKPDHLHIKLAGMQNFVRKKFYAFMASELGRLGFVTAGSTNFIRRLPDNEGLPREEWTDRSGGEWGGAELETVNLQSIEWRIEQLEK
jgi:hypothetical protein